MTQGTINDTQSAAVTSSRTVLQIAKLNETTGQQSIIGTAIVDDIFIDAIETTTKPKKLDFEKPKSMFSRLLSPFRISRPKALTTQSSGANTDEESLGHHSVSAPTFQP